jgi:hypothetical protein
MSFIGGPSVAGEADGPSVLVPPEHRGGGQQQMAQGGGPSERLQKMGKPRVII